MRLVKFFYVLHQNDTYNIMLKANHMYQNNNAIYMHLLYYATKIFIDNNKIMNELMTINQTIVRDSQKCILGYSNVIMYILNSIKEPHSQTAHESHLEQILIPHVILHAIDNDYTRLGQVLEDTPVDKDTMILHVSCTTSQINTYFNLQSKCRSQ